jgi:hypothetical protein
MSYLEMLKNSKNTLNGELPKLPKGGSGSFGSGSSRHFPENKASTPDTWGLPTACPMLDQPVPDECRFEEKLFWRMVNQGVLYPGGPCPLRKVCKL